MLIGVLLRSILGTIIVKIPSFKVDLIPSITTSFCNDITCLKCFTLSLSLLSALIIIELALNSIPICSLVNPGTSTVIKYWSSFAIILERWLKPAGSPAINVDYLNHRNTCSIKESSIAFGV